MGGKRYRGPSEQITGIYRDDFEHIDANALELGIIPEANLAKGVYRTEHKILNVEHNDAMGQIKELLRHFRGMQPLDPDALDKGLKWLNRKD